MMHIPVQRDGRAHGRKSTGSGESAPAASCMPARSSPRSPVQYASDGIQESNGSSEGWQLARRAGG